MKFMLSRTGKVVVGLALSLFLVFGGALGAQAASNAMDAAVHAQTGVATANIVPTAVIDEGGSDTNQPVSETDLNVPMYRWTNGTQGFHFQVDGNPVNAVMRGSERLFLYSLPMMIGNSAWLGASSLLEGAVGFKMMNLIGYQVDQAAAGIGEAILKSPIIVLAMVVLVFGSIFMLKKGERPWKRISSSVIVLGIFAVMTFGGRASTDTNGYTPGVGSPGWFLTLLTDATSNITTSIATSLDMSSFTGGGGQWQYTCDNYMEAIISKQKPPAKTSSTAPMASALWVQSGLKAWKMAQFGDNFYAKLAYCHVLDWDYPNQAEAILNESAKWPTANPRSGALAPNSDEKRDRSGIAWAVCYWSTSSESWRANTAFFGYPPGTDPIPETANLMWGPGDSADSSLGGPNGGFREPKHKYEGEGGYCSEWWSKDAKDWGSSDKFNVGPNSNDVTAFLGGNTSSPTKKVVADFLNYWHGSDNAGIGVTTSYVVASAIISLVFLVVAAAVFFVNIALVVTLLSIFIVLLVVLFTKNDMQSRLSQFVKSLMGLVVFSALAGLLIAMIAKITEILSTVGGTIFKEAPIAMMIWTGISPLLALVMLHFVFTKLLRAPSPFKLSSALAWGAAAGAAGGALGSALSNSVGRGERRVENAIKSAPGAAIRKAKNAVTGGSKTEERAGSASPRNDKISSAVGSHKEDSEQIASAGEVPQTARERRAELKEAKKQAKADRDALTEEAKSGNDKYLSKMDSVLGGNGLAAMDGWRGKVNQASRKLGVGDVLSDKDHLDERSLSERIVGEGKMNRTLDKWKENRKEARAAFAEKWAGDRKGAIGDVLKKTGKYSALLTAGALTGGLAVAGYAAYKTGKGYVGASKELGYKGGTEQTRAEALESLRKRRADERETARAEAEANAGAAAPVAAQSTPEAQHVPEVSPSVPTPTFAPHESAPTPLQVSQPQSDPVAPGGVLRPADRSQTPRGLDTPGQSEPLRPADRSQTPRNLPVNPQQDTPLRPADRGRSRTDSAAQPPQATPGTPTVTPRTQPSTQKSDRPSVTPPAQPPATETRRERRDSNRPNKPSGDPSPDKP